ncbi:hypothetical protein BRY73_02775 [Ochrobactrum sp. P6BS-III]|uniref:hypothetical protein n=1 Tax=unclassified Ochrobactrum TaxID=239106 RepID=UPI0009927E3D|nr:hypothetical protein [Ochrobactrum sp. P6BSIII]OOL20102.1 hypothetical protein BRY73_02775 [Ochrobactrum sp. P6BS-III]
MPQRIKITTSGIYVSKPGFDVDTASQENLSMYPGMEPMRPLGNGTATFTGSGSQDFAISNPTGAIPYVVMRSSESTYPGRITFGAEMWEPYTTVRIRNFDGVARTITWYVLL